MKILIATGNQGKFEEIMHSLSDLPFDFVSLKELGFSIPESIEDGVTYEENAFKKAKYCALKSGLMCLADDSGLIVNALQGELGVFTRRWGAGANASDQEWLEYFLKKIEGVVDRRAMFVSCICVVNGVGSIVATSRGESSGVLMESIEVPIKSGIPLSSVFKASGCSLVHSAMPIEEKNRISHRGASLRMIKEKLRSIDF